MPCSIESGILLGVFTERATVGELVRPIHDRMPVILRPEDKSNGSTFLEQLSARPVAVETVSGGADGRS